MRARCFLEPGVCLLDDAPTLRLVLLVFFGVFRHSFGFFTLPFSVRGATGVPGDMLRFVCGLCGVLHFVCGLHDALRFACGLRGVLRFACELRDALRFARGLRCVLRFV